jgi:YD repeat-containing protein
VNIDESDCYAFKCNGLFLEGCYAVSFRYDETTGQLMSRTNTRGGTAFFSYDNHGQLKEILHPTGYRLERKMDEKGNVLEISDGFGIQKGYDYDEIDRVKEIRTAAGTTHFTYGDGGNLKLILDPRSVETLYSYDNQHNLKDITDGEGRMSSYEYNAHNQLTHISLSNGSCKTIEYDSFGHLSKEIWGK